MTKSKKWGYAGTEIFILRLRRSTAGFFRSQSVQRTIPGGIDGLGSTGSAARSCSGLVEAKMTKSQKWGYAVFWTLPFFPARYMVHTKLLLKGNQTENFVIYDSRGSDST